MNIEQILKEKANEVKAKYSKEEKMESCKSIVLPRFYQLALKPIIDKQELIDDHFKSHWSKLLQNVDYNEGVLYDFIRAAFGHYDGIDANLMSINMNDEISKNFTMIWAGSPNKKQLRKLGKLMKKALPKDLYEIEVIDGDNFSNRELEEYVKKRVKRMQFLGKRYIIVSKYIGARSFSVPEIETVFLWYDGGNVNSTAQRISRVFTNGKDWDGNKKNLGNVVSFSFDPNREESTPVDEYIIGEADKLENDDLNDSVRKIFASVQIFQNDERGVILPLNEVKKDAYVNRLINSSSLIKAAESSINPTVIDLNDPELLNINVSSQKEKREREEAVNRSKAKTFVEPKEKNQKKELTEDQERERESIKVRRKALQAVVHRIIALTEINEIESDDFIEMLDMIHQKALDDEVIVEIGVDTRVIKRWAEAGAFSLKLLNTIISVYNYGERKLIEKT